MSIAVTPLPTERHIAQRARWPRSGQHILAHHDASSVVVYQAYRPAIGEYAIRHGRLDGPDFSLSRMSWIKPNFLWMMYRSGWGTKEGQEVTLGLRLRRAFFERLVREAVPSTFDALDYPSREAWQEAVGRSEVRLQWDPDHSPRGASWSAARSSWACAGAPWRPSHTRNCWRSSTCAPSWTHSARSRTTTTTPRCNCRWSMCSTSAPETPERRREKK